MKLSRSIFTLLVGMFISSSASAVTMDLGTVPFSIPNFTFSSRTFNVGGVDVTLQASGGISPFLQYTAGDGYGVNQFLNIFEEGDEIDQVEFINITFSESVSLNSFTVSNLFTESSFFGGTYAERGAYSLNGGPAVQFSALNPGGNLSVNTAGALINSLVFSAINVAFQSHDYSIKSLDFNRVVPEPASLALLSAGLLGAGRLRRRQSIES